MKGFSFYATVSAAVAAFAALVVALVPATADSRLAAWLGVGLATASGAIALLLKRRSMATEGLESLTSGMKTLGQTMGMRVMVLALGLFWVARHTDGSMAFVVGFFAVYLTQQWLEISYLLTEQRRRSQLPKVHS